jgi:hypothetical protein
MALGARDYVQRTGRVVNWRGEAELIEEVSVYEAAYIKRHRLRGESVF